MAFDARVHVCLWSLECDSDNVDWKIGLFKQLPSLCCLGLHSLTQWKVPSIT